MNLQLYRNGNPTVQVPIDESTIYVHEVMGVWEIQAEFIAAFPLDIKVDDYIVYKGERYEINVEFQCEKRSNFEYLYRINFEHVIYRLKDKMLMHLGAVEFSYFGTAVEYMLLIIDNMNQDDSGWTVGTVETTGARGISFFGDERGYTCKGALMKVAEEFGLEFWATGKTIHLTLQAGNDTNLDFEYGQSRGLYSIVRGMLEAPRYNRIYGFGSMKNIPFTYRDGAKRLVFENRKIESVLQPGERRRETSVIFEDIFPNRTAPLSAVSEDWRSLTDSTLDFDINAQLVEGETAKIVFQTGELAGKEYEITSYDAATKTMRINPLVEEDGYTTPNATFAPAVGDEYTLIGISMPQVYVDEAEEMLLTETNKVFNRITRPPYEIVIDPKYMRDNAITLKAGDRVRLKDVGLGIDDMIRVYSVSFPLVDPYNVTAVISDTVVYRTEVRQEVEKNQIKDRVLVVDRTKAELARQNMLRMRSLQGLIFDPDGYFDPENIKPGSIETGMLSVGVKSQNYALSGVEIEANHLGNPNALRVSGGQLIHFEIELEGLGYVWEMAANIIEELNPVVPYYLYARCSKSALAGTWVVSTEPLLTESEAGFYHFWVGIVYAESDGVRFFQFTKGMTFIVGDTIKTGRIQSVDGLSFLDLSQGTFKVGDSEQSIDWGVTAAGQLTLNGVLVTKMIFAEDAEIINLIVKALKTNLTGKRVEITEDNNTIRFFNGDGVQVLEINDTLGFDINSNQMAGMAVDNPDNARSSFVAASGIISNASLMPFISITAGLYTNASIVGVLTERNIDPNGLSAGVVGLDATSSGNSDSFGGYFNTLKVDGLYLRARAITASTYNAVRSDVFISCYNTINATVNLPVSPKDGKLMYIRRNNNETVTIAAASPIIINNGAPVSSIDIPSRGDMALMIWDGSYWTYNVMQ